MNRNQQLVIEYLQEEVKILKEIQGAKRLRFSDEQRKRIAIKAKRVKFSRLKDIANLVTPQALLAWHRRLVAKKYDSSEVRGRRAGRPPARQSINELVIRFAQENRHWGYTSIMGALLNLGHEVGRGTIVEILKDAGIEPSPARKKGPSWEEFLKHHWDVIAATDFFTVEVWTGRIGALSCAFCDSTGDTKGSDCRDYSRAEWGLDEADRAKSDRLRKRILDRL